MPKCEKKIPKKTEKILEKYEFPLLGVPGLTSNKKLLETRNKYN